MDPSVKPPVYNFRPYEGEPGEMPGTSFFLREGDEVFHTNSTYARGAEMTGGSYYFLDLTASAGRRTGRSRRAAPRARTARSRTSSTGASV